MEWKIFYSDRTFSDDDGPPERAPKRDVQCIVVRDELCGRRIEAGDHFYLWIPGRGMWRGADQYGLFDYLIEPGFKIVLFGRSLSDREYRLIWDKATHDPAFPPKSARLPYERSGGPI